MGVSKSAVKVPMKKLFAVATLVGAASGTAIVTSMDAPPPTPSVVQAAPVAVVVPEPAPVIPPIERNVIEPLTLTTGSPACGNMAFKGGGPPPCPPPIKAAKRAIVSIVAGAAPTDDVGPATRAKPRTYSFNLLR